MPKDPNPPKDPKAPTEYQVVTAETPEALRTAIENLISDGWRPQGGIGFHFYYERRAGYELFRVTTYLQAVVR